MLSSYLALLYHIPIQITIPTLNSSGTPPSIFLNYCKNISLFSICVFHVLLSSDSISYETRIFFTIIYIHLILNRSRRQLELRKVIRWKYRIFL